MVLPDRRKRPALTVAMVICASVTSFSFFAIMEPVVVVPALSPVGITLLTSLLGLALLVWKQNERLSQHRGIKDST